MQQLYHIRNFHNQIVQHGVTVSLNANAAASPETVKRDPLRMAQYHPTLLMQIQENGKKLMNVD